MDRPSGQPRKPLCLCRLTGDVRFSMSANANSDSTDAETNNADTDADSGGPTMTIHGESSDDAENQTEANEAASDGADAESSANAEANEAVDEAADADADAADVDADTSASSDVEASGADSDAGTEDVADAADAEEGSEAAENAGGDTEDDEEDGIDTNAVPSDDVHVVADASLLRDFLGVASAIDDETRLLVREDGIHIKLVDPASVAMADATLRRSSLENFSPSVGTIAVDLDRLQSYLKTADSNDLVDLHYDSDTRKLEINAGGMHFSMGTIQPESLQEIPEIPELELPTTATVDKSVFSRGLSAADLTSDYVSLAGDPDENTFVVSASGDTDDMRFEIDADRAEALDLDETEALFALEYLKEVESGLPSGDLTIRTGDDFPTKISVDTDAINALYMVAPRIDPDDA
ncbi:hypothetical protein RYH80_18355 [Halobaculum sp. MBLA0147]|uniref:hypothetical protein n=1 Tax=Halobaculum sp. MBLA0147 TaxID=3079934 RepID=UPI0035235D2C